MEISMDTAPLPGLADLLQVADLVARDKGIEREQVIEAMEMAIGKAGRSKYGLDFDIRAHVDRQTGEIKLARYREAVEDIENDATQIILPEARRKNPDIQPGEFLIDPLPPLDFGRIAAQTAKQAIVQKVREVERQRQYEEYKDRVGEIINGVVKRIEMGNVVVDLGRAEAVLRREELLGRESFRRTDRVRAYILDVREETHGPQIFLSRAAPEFMSALFAQEVPEIYDNVIEIKAVARDPGSRAKIAVTSSDSSIDSVGACVGMRGSRVQAVVSELQGEKIDIIPWSADTPTFIVNALAPAEVTKVVIDEDANRVEVVVPDDQLSLAIGRRGQNVRLASILTGWHIDILTEADESERRNEEFQTLSKLFMDTLDVDDVIAHLLVTEGFTSVEEVAFVPIEDLSGIEGFDESICEELRGRAQTYLSEKEESLRRDWQKLGVDPVLATIPHLTGNDLVMLGENGVKTLDDLADLASDELQEILSSPLRDQAEYDRIILAARAHWFPDDPLVISTDSSSDSEAEPNEDGAETPQESPDSPGSDKKVEANKGEENASK